MVGLREPGRVGRVALDVLDDLEAVGLEEGLGRLGPQTHGLEGVEVDHRHLCPGPRARR